MSLLRTHSTSLLSLLVLGTGLVVPQLAHADEVATAASVEQSTQALPAANVARPLQMRDLGTTSSIGLAVEGTSTTLDYGALGEDKLQIGVLRLDAELAVGEHLKVFGSFPMTRTEIRSSDASVEGHGNLTLGVQFQGSSGIFRGGVGGSVSQWGDDDSTIAILDHFDAAGFTNDGTVLSAFGTLQAGEEGRYVQAQGTYTRVSPDQEGISTRRDRSYGQATLGGGLRLGHGPMILGEVGLVRIFPAFDEEQHENIYLAQVGVRGAFSRSLPGSWAATTSILHDETVTSVSLGLELRADLPGLGK